MTCTSDKQLSTYRYYIAFHITILLAIHTTCHPSGGSWNGNIFSSSSSSPSSPSSSSSSSSYFSSSSPSSPSSSSFYISPSGLTLHSSSSSLMVSSPNQITKRASDDYSSPSFADCTLGNPLRDTCERCSKASRSRDAYAKCCQSPGEVRTFCQALLNYTFPGRPRKLSRNFHPRWWYLP